MAILDFKKAKLIYVAHPYGGNDSNKIASEENINKLFKLYPDRTFISPLHGICCPYDSVSFEEGMEHCFKLLEKCDALLLTGYWETSKGCALEQEFAKNHNIPIFYLSPTQFNYLLPNPEDTPAEDKPDKVIDHPQHYTQGGIECIEAIKAATTNLTGIKAVCTANAIKYLWRWNEKNGTEDLRKAEWYINKLISEVNNE